MINRPTDGLGASDAAAVLGVSRWKTPLDVYNEKVGIVEPGRKAEHQEWGLLLEDAIAARYMQETGRRVQKWPRNRDGDRIARSKDHPLLYAHPDRAVVGERGLVEIKTSYRRWDEIPIYYKTQAIQQMLCTDREWVDFAVLEGGQRYNGDWRVDRSRTLEETFAAELEEWWEKHVLARVPPDMDGLDAGRQYLRKMHPSGDGGEVVATANMLPLINRYRNTRFNREQAEREEEVLKQKVQQLIGDASAIVGPFGKIMWTRFTASKVDWKMVALDLERAIVKAVPGKETEDAVAFIKSMHSQVVQSSRFTPAWKEEKTNE